MWYNELYYIKEVSGLNDENLIPFTQRTEKERREICSKGGKASQAKQREKKRFKELAKMLSELEAPSKAKKQLQAMGIEETDATNKTLMLIGLMQSVQRDGNVKAFEKWQELIDEKDIATEQEIAQENAQTDLLNAIKERSKRNED